MNPNLDLGLRLLVSILFLYLYYISKKKSDKDEQLNKWIHNFRIQIDNPIYTILVPIFLMLMVTRCFSKNVIIPEGNPFLLLMVAVLAQPIVEEIMMRGWIFGFFITISEQYPKLKRILFLTIGLFIQSILFMGLHFQDVNIPRLVTGFVFGLLFLFSKRNLVPCAVAHMAWNFFIVILKF